VGKGRLQVGQRLRLRYPLDCREAEGSCPYCCEPVAIWVDAGGGRAQRYVEDCSVCCRPIEVQVSTDEDGEASVSLARDDD